MNKTLKLAFGAVLGAALFVPALAQDNFPDAPEMHWAYRALLNMKNEGILVGYPDGLFRGGRPASRYELAAAINAAFENLKGRINGLQSQITALEQRINQPTGQFATKADLDQLRNELANLRRDLDAMKSWGDDIENLKRMASMFERDLAAIGVDVEAMKKDIADLAELVKGMPKPAVDIHGDVNLIMLAGNSRDDTFGVTVDGRPTGVDRGSNFGHVGGLTDDTSIGHEAAFQFDGTNAEGPKWTATVVIGNLMGFSEGGLLFGDQSTTFPGAPFTEPSTSIYIQEAMVEFDTSVWGQGFTAKLGRMGYQAGNYFFQRPDATPYFKNDRWDNGNWYFDGGLLMFDWGSVGLDVWAGRNSSRFDDLFTEINPMFVGMSPLGAPFAGDRPVGLNSSGIMVDQSLGFHAGIKLGDNGNIGLNYIFLDSDFLGADPDGGAPYNRMSVWGGELDWKFGNNFSLNGGYSQSDYQMNTNNVLDEDNFAWWVKLGYQGSNWSAGVAYREVAPYFGAPGDWGRIGIWWNPTDVMGFDGYVKFMPSSSVGLKLGAKLWTGTDDGGGITEDDDIFSVYGHLSFNLSQNWSGFLGGEWVRWDLDGVAGEPTESWYRIGLTYDLGGDQALKFMYEISDYDADGVTAFQPGTWIFLPGVTNDPDRLRGGFLTTQWSKKF
ncbi:MAG: S-layer homology domain-containing protein [Armatimonadota bacterium]